MCYCSYDVCILPSNCICLLPHSICNARHAWTLTLTLHSIMILHQREREPITSVHWACKHDVCFVICHLHNCLVTQVLSATRYVKISRKFIIHPRHGSYGRLEEEKRVCLKTSSICHPSRSRPQHLFEIIGENGRKRDVINVVCLSCHVPLRLNVYSPLCGPYRGLHHLTNPMHTLSAPCPNRIAHHIY